MKRIPLKRIPLKRPRRSSKLFYYTPPKLSRRMLNVLHEIDGIGNSVVKLYVALLANAMLEQEPTLKRNDGRELEQGEV